MTAKHTGIILFLLLREFAKRNGTRYIGCTAVILSATVEQQETFCLEQCILFFIGFIMYYCRVLAIGCNGSKAESTEQVILTAEFSKLCINVKFMHATLFNCRFQPMKQVYHGYTLTEHGAFKAFYLSLVLQGLHSCQRRVAEHTLAIGQ